MDDVLYVFYKINASSQANLTFSMYFFRSIVGKPLLIR